jgi:WD40 repeat protein
MPLYISAYELVDVITEGDRVASALKLHSILRKKLSEVVTGLYIYRESTKLLEINIPHKSFYEQDLPLNTIKCYSISQTEIACVQKNNSIAIVHKRTGKVTTTLKNTRNVACLIPYNDFQIITYNDRTGVTVWNIETEQIEYNIKTLDRTSENPINMVLMPNDILVASVCEGLMVWDLSLREQVNYTYLHSVDFYSMTKYSQTVLLAGHDKKLCFWDVNELRVLHTITGPFKPVTSILLLAPGVISCGSDEEFGN